MCIVKDFQNSCYFISQYLQVLAMPVKRKCEKEPKLRNIQNVML